MYLLSGCRWLGGIRQQSRLSESQCVLVRLSMATGTPSKSNRLVVGDHDDQASTGEERPARSWPEPDPLICLTPHLPAFNIRSENTDAKR
jgi:hypothetical protein